MKWLLSKITGVAIVNFIFLVFVTMLISFQKRPIIQRVNSAADVSGNPTAVPTSVPERNLFTELKNHNVKSDCWMSYRGNVYDITPVFGTHPGGDAIMLKYCGSDATIGFDAVPHSANAVNLLAQYLIQ